MKNRLQFNRHFALYETREEAINAFNKRITDPGFIPLIGEPIVLRYKDENGNVQVILAIGKKGGRSLQEREYHLVDTAELNEKIEFEAGRIDNLSAGTVFGLDAVNNRVSELSATTESFSGATDEFIKRIIAAAGLAEDGSYIHDHSTHFIDEVISLAEADHELDAAAYDILTNATASADTLNSKIDGEIARATAAEDSISGSVDTFSAATVAEIARLDDKIDAATVSSGDKTVVVTPSAAGTDLSVNIDGVTIAKDNNGVLSTKLTIAKLETPSSVNVKEEYELIDNNGGRHGETIKIYKDSSLYRVYLGHVDDSLVSYEDPTVIPGTGDAALCLIYQRVDGLYELVAVNVESFLEESEFKDGLVVNNHEVSVKIDNSSEDFLGVSLDGVKLSGVQDAINAAQAEEEARAIAVENAIQTELDKTQTGAGLASDGSYIHDHPTNYIDNATSLADADHKLDVAVGSLSGVVNSFSANTAAEIEGLKADIADETERATAAENSISGEVSTLKESVTVLSSVTVSEINRATAAENSISGQVTTLSGNVIAFSSATVSEIARLSEKTDATQAELDKTQTGAGLESDGSYRPVENANYISGAASLREADAKLDVALKGVSSDAAASANTLNNAIEAEKNRAITAENAINNNVENLSSVVESLSAGTVAEVNRAVSAETVLDGRVRNLENASVTGENAISVESTGLNKKVTLVIDASDNVLTQSLGGLKTTLRLNYDSTNSKVQLLGNAGVVLSEFDSSDFIKDGMIQSVTFDPATNILLITWNTAAGHDSTRIDLSGLVDVYTVAPESHTFMEINGYVVKLNTDITDGLASFNYARSISAITDNIISATGLNIGDPGTYPHHDETHYIKNAGSLDQADVLLDAAIWEASAISVDVNNRLNNLSSVTESFSAHTNEKVNELSALTREFSAATYNTFRELSGATGDFSASTLAKINELSAVTREFSAATHNTIRELSANTHNTIRELSGVTRELSASTHETIRELSAVTRELSGATMSVSGKVGEVATGLATLSAVTEQIISGGTGGDVTELSAATVALSEECANFFDGAVYDSIAKTIVFKNGNVEKASIDATEFIKDGMVSAVTISGGNMIISFNTDAGREDIELELTDIFDPDNYYTKDEINNGVSASTLALSAATVEAIDDLDILSGAFIDNTYVVSLSLNDLNNKVNEISGNTGIVDGLSAATTGLSAATVVISNNVTALSAATTTISGNVTALSAATVAISNNVSNVSGAVVSLSAVTEAISGLVETNKNGLQELSATVMDDQFVIAQAFNDLDGRIVELSGATPDASNYYTTANTYNKTEVDENIADAISGQTIIIEGTISGGGFRPSAGPSIEVAAQAFVMGKTILFKANNKYYQVINVELSGQTSILRAYDLENGQRITWD